jgi:hypothetical protein
VHKLGRFDAGAASSASTADELRRELDLAARAVQLAERRIEHLERRNATLAQEMEHGRRIEHEASGGSPTLGTAPSPVRAIGSRGASPKKVSPSRLSPSLGTAPSVDATAVVEQTIRQATHTLKELTSDKLAAEHKALVLENELAALHDAQHSALEQLRERRALDKQLSSALETALEQRRLFQSLKVTNNADVGGDLHVTGHATVDQTLIIKGASTLNSLKVTGHASMNSLDVTGSTSLHSFIVVVGTSSFNGNMNITGSVYVSGPIVSGDEASATAFSTTSDRRLKKDFAEVADALAKVQALHPVFYNWISSPNVNPAEPELGFIAQEVEEVIPGVVSTADDEMKTKRVCYDRITSLLVAAMKEQSAVIAALQARVASLESRA